MQRTVKKRSKRIIERLTGLLDYFCMPFVWIFIWYLDRDTALRPWDVETWERED